MPSIQERYLKVCQLADAARARSEFAEAPARVLVVSKRWPAETVRQIVDCGHSLFGESRIQEAEEKIPALPDHLDWHFIGHIQKNKVRKILTLFDTLHSVDSIALAQRISSIAGELGHKPDIFLQVNIASEPSKHGFEPDALRSQISEILNLPNLTVRGLMAIPPAVADPDESRPHFQATRALQQELSSATGTALDELSMGMSGDYEVAIEEGSTIVRVGSSIFGPRLN